MNRLTVFVISEAIRPKRGKELPSQPPVKSAPHYFEKSVPAQFLISEHSLQINNKKVSLEIKSYHPDAILVVATMEIDDIFSSGALELKDKLLDVCYEYAKKNGAKEEPSEEYTIYQISGYKGDPEIFLEKYGGKIAGLLKSEKLELDEKEIEQTLSYQLKYAKDDLVIIDWDGAFVFDPDGEIGEMVELFEIANYQLLRYRILDEDLDERMTKISKIIQAPPKKRWGWMPSKEVTEEFREVIRLRSTAISQFEALERNIKLIGDWYSARLYDFLSKKFRLDDWHKEVRDKLESLEDVYSIASENLGMSRIQRLELLQIAGFFILQIGWFVLIILEFIYFTR